MKSIGGLQVVLVTNEYIRHLVESQRENIDMSHVPLGMFLSIPFISSFFYLFLFHAKYCVAQGF